jgi:hypothetical protein
MAPSLASPKRLYPHALQHKALRGQKVGSLPDLLVLVRAPGRAVSSGALALAHPARRNRAHTEVSILGRHGNGAAKCNRFSAEASPFSDGSYCRQAIRAI